MKNTTYSPVRETYKSLRRSYRIAHKADCANVAAGNGSFDASRSLFDAGRKLTNNWETGFESRNSYSMFGYGRTRKIERNGKTYFRAIQVVTNTCSKFLKAA